MNLIAKLVEVLSANWKVRVSCLVEDAGYLTKIFEVILLPPLHHKKMIGLLPSIKLRNISFYFLRCYVL